MELVKARPPAGTLVGSEGSRWEERLSSVVIQDSPEEPLPGLDTPSG